MWFATKALVRIIRFYQFYIHKDIFNQ